MQCLSPEMNCKQLKIAQRKPFGASTASEVQSASDFYSAHNIPLL